MLDILTYATYAAYADIHTIHLHTWGNKFDIVHEVADRYYKQLQVWYDKLSEKAIGANCLLAPVSLYYQHAQLNGWSPAPMPTNKSDYEYWEAVRIIQGVLCQLLKYVNEVEGSSSIGVKNFLGEVAEWLEDEIRYFNNQRQEV